MIWKVRDPNRWRKCFAVFPKRIGDKWIWLSRYAWRPLPEEYTQSPPFAFRFYQEFSLPCGYCIWKEHFNVVGCPLVSISWVSPKATLKVVDEHRG